MPIALRTAFPSNSNSFRTTSAVEEPCLTDPDVEPILAVESALVLLYTNDMKRVPI